MKAIILTFVAVFLGFYIAGEVILGKHASYVMRDPRFMDQLKPDDLEDAAKTGIYNELCIEGTMTSTYLTWIIDIYEDGSGVFRESVFTETGRKYLKEDAGSPSDSEAMLMDLPVGDYVNYYLFSIPKDDLLLFLHDLGNDESFDDEIEVRAGHELGFGFHVFLNGRGKRLVGWMYEPPPTSEKKTRLGVCWRQ